MQKDFDMKVMILKLNSLESEVKKLKQKLKIKNDDPIFKKENPERIITIRKKKIMDKLRQNTNNANLKNLTEVCLEQKFHTKYNQFLNSKKKGKRKMEI